MQELGDRGSFKSSMRFILALIPLLGLLHLPCFALNADTKSPPTSHMLQGSVAQSELIDSLEKMGIKCAIKEGKPISLMVVGVHLGSMAYYRNVSEGDEIKAVTREDDGYLITLSRNGKVFQAFLKSLSRRSQAHDSEQAMVDQRTLKSAARTDLLRAGASKAELRSTVSKDGDQVPILKADQPKVAVTNLGQQKFPIVDVNDKNNPTLDVNDHHDPVLDVNQRHVPIMDVNERKKQQEKKLIRYDIELIIDITGSMNEIDGTGELTKFEWCRNQVRSLAQRLAPYGDDLTITIFNEDFETFQRCTPGKVDEIYSEIHPHGWTDLVDPLTTRLKAIRSKIARGGRPTLVAVIHDGLPNRPPDPRVVNRALIDYSQTLSKPDQVIVTFLQIGDTFEGRDFCIDLADNLVNEGAKYDFVDTRTFAELKKDGLVPALVDALEEKLTAIRTHSKVANKQTARFVRSMPKSDVHTAEQKTALDTSIKEKEERRRELERQLLGN